MARNDTRKAYTSLVSEPQNKAKIMAKVRKLFPFFNDVEDDALWEELSLKDKINYLK